MKSWKPYVNDETMDTKGIDNGVIINDEEYSNEARITLEAGGHAPYSISCGIYGIMFHTAFAEDRTKAVNKYEEMKEAVAEFLNDNDDTDASDFRHPRKQTEGENHRLELYQ